MNTLYLIRISHELNKKEKTNSGFSLDMNFHKKKRTKTIKMPFFEPSYKTVGSKNRDMNNLFKIIKNFRTMSIACSDNFPPIIDTLCLKAGE